MASFGLSFPFIASIIALIAAIYFIMHVNRKPVGTPKMQKIADAIKEGAMAYLSREYKIIAVFAIIITAALWYFIDVPRPGPFYHAPTAITFAVGAIFSALAGYIGMKISVKANIRTTEAARSGLKEGLDVAVKGGAVTGFFVAGLALLGVTFFYWLYRDPVALVGFGFGGSLISLFARIGGGIYTKAADVGADLVGKVEAGIPEDDPRNPATIADNVGDNVGDCAGMAADLFETYAIAAIGSILLGFAVLGDRGALIPLLLGGGAIFASIIGLFFVRVNKSIMAALYKGLIGSSVLSIIIFYLLLEANELNIFLSSIIGIVIGLALFGITEFYTSKDRSPVKSITAASNSGPATNVIAGLAVGLRSTWMPAILIVIGIVSTFALAGLYGVSIAVMAMLSLTAIIITMDAYGPITDNAGGIAEMAKLPKGVRKVTDELDSVGNTTKAVTKTFAVGSAALAALTLFAAYVEELVIAREAIGLTGELIFSLQNPLVLSGLIIGGLIPFFFSSMLMSAVGNGANKIVEEVRRQFKAGILKGKAQPDYAQAVDIATKASLRAMAGPALLAVIAPLAVGFLLGPLALGGLLVGSILTGFLLALQLCIGGGAWDNAKKLVEDGEHGGKGSEAHKAAVVGDTVGDPFKDTAGPAINPLIKVMNTIAIIFIGLIVLFALV